MSVIKIDWNPVQRTLRQFGVIGIFAFSLFAYLVHKKAAMFALVPAGAALPTIYGLLALAAYCAVCAAVAPAALRWLYVGLSVVGYPIGFVVSYIVLALMFFLVITPIGFLFRAIGRDALRLRFDPAAPTYWIPRHPPASVKRYFRQF